MPQKRIDARQSLLENTNASLAHMRIFMQSVTQEIRGRGVMRRPEREERPERPSNSLLTAQNHLQLQHKRSSFRRHGREH